MKIKRSALLLIAAALLIFLAACSNYAGDYREGSVHPPAATRSTRTRASRNNLSGVPGYTTHTRSTPQVATRPTQKPCPPTSTWESTCGSDYGFGPYSSVPVPSYATQTPTRSRSTASTPITKPPVVIQVPPEARPTSNQEKVSITAGRVLGSHTTEFNAKEENRVTNITKASNSISGHVVNPGDTFSYNETVGPTIERRGYKKGIIFVDGEKKEGFGGGVCQVSTTLSMAAEEAGMTITERHDHSLPVSYAEEGDEAATSYGVIDFKFKNEKPFPIMINSVVQEGMISVEIREA